MKIASIRLSHETAGLSPHNNDRVEVFLAGCKMAAEGSPCKGCFNPDLWKDSEVFPDITPEEAFQDILEFDNKYVTIVGGEPLDQAKELSKLLRLLRENDFHIALFTHYGFSIDICWNPDFKLCADLCNCVIDEPYYEDQRIFNTSTVPGVRHVIGSENQNLWVQDLDGWKVVDKNDENKVKEAWMCKNPVLESSIIWMRNVLGNLNFPTSWEAPKACTMPQ